MGIAGAPGSVPGATSSSYCWLRTPHGSTANSTIHQIKKKIATAVVTGIFLGLLQFDQSAGKILRVQEQHRLAMRADLWLAVAEDA